MIVCQHHWRGTGTVLLAIIRVSLHGARKQTGGCWVWGSLSFAADVHSRTHLTL